MTILASCLLFGSHLVNNDLLASAMGHDLELDAGILDVGLAEGCALGVLHEKHAVQLDRCINIGGNPIQVVVPIGLQPDLGAGGFHNGVGTLGVGPCICSFAAGIRGWFGIGHVEEDAVRLGKPDSA